MSELISLPKSGRGRVLNPSGSHGADQMRMTNLRRALLVTVTAASLAAYAQTGRLAPLDGNAASDIRSDVEQQMAESAARAASSLETLAIPKKPKCLPALEPGALKEGCSISGDGTPIWGPNTAILRCSGPL